MGIVTVLWEKWTEFRRDFVKITVSAIISPIMYLIIFGLGIDAGSQGGTYLRFLIPGLVAMASMTGSFGAIVQSMSVQRLYEKALDQVMISPTPLWQFILGQIIGGSLRGMYASLLIILVTLPLSTGLCFNALSLLAVFLNGMVFSTFALVLSFLAKSYADAPRFTSYIITPMSFLCNTFFSTERMPQGIRQLLSLLPLSQASAMIRAIAWEESPALPGFLVLFCYLIVLGAVSVGFIYKKENL